MNAGWHPRRECNVSFRPETACAHAGLKLADPYDLNLPRTTGVFLFRKFFMTRNWRMTFVWTTFLLALNNGFQLMVIYNVSKLQYIQDAVHRIRTPGLCQAWGVGQDGWFYAFGSLWDAFKITSKTWHSFQTDRQYPDDHPGNRPGLVQPGGGGDFSSRI